MGGAWKRFSEHYKNAKKSGEKYVFWVAGILVSHNNTMNSKCWEFFRHPWLLSRGTAYFLNFHKWQNILCSHAENISRPWKNTFIAWEELKSKDNVYWPYKKTLSLPIQLYFSVAIADRTRWFKKKRKKKSWMEEKLCEVFLEKCV